MCFLCRYVVENVSHSMWGGNLPRFGWEIWDSSWCQQFHRNQSLRTYPRIRRNCALNETLRECVRFVLRKSRSTPRVRKLAGRPPKGGAINSNVFFRHRRKNLPFAYNETIRLPWGDFPIRNPTQVPARRSVIAVEQSVFRSQTIKLKRRFFFFRHTAHPRWLMGKEKHGVPLAVIIYKIYRQNGLLF